MMDNTPSLLALFFPTGLVVMGITVIIAVMLVSRGGDPQRMEGILRARAGDDDDEDDDHAFILSFNNNN